MRKLFLVTLTAILFSCNSSKSDKENKTDSTTTKTDTSANKPATDPAAASTQLIIDPANDPGKVAYAVFQQNGQTLFYYNVDTKNGSISINGVKYDFTSYAHEINGSTYTLRSGDKLAIDVEGVKYHDYENPEPGILKGKAEKITITVGNEKIELKDVDVVDGTNAD